MFKINQFKNAVKYSFKDSSLAELALSHSSFVNERKKNKLSSYERLEFLGDAIVDMIVSEYLYSNYPNLDEGELTKARAIVVCESTFYKCSKEIGLGVFLQFGKGEEMTGGRDRASILADIFESITGAIYIDGGYDNAKKFVIGNLKSIINDAIDGSVFMDYKSQLQEKLQENGVTNINYKIIGEKGPDHNKLFEMQVSNNGIALGKGIGKSKKEAEQEAAKEAIKSHNL